MSQKHNEEIRAWMLRLITASLRGDEVTADDLRLAAEAAAEAGAY